MSNKTVFKTNQLIKEYKEGISDMRDQKFNIESLIISIEDKEPFYELVREIDDHVAFINSLIDKLPKKFKIREKDHELASELILDTDNFIQAHLEISTKINEVLLPLMKNLVPDSADSLRDLQNETIKGLN